MTVYGPPLPAVWQPIRLNAPVRFRSNQAQLDPTAFVALDQVVALVQNSGNIAKLRIRAQMSSPAGHLTRQLAEARAAVVRRYLAAQGIAPEKLEIIKPVTAASGDASQSHVVFFAASGEPRRSTRTSQETIPWESQP